MTLIQPDLERYPIPITEPHMSLTLTSWKEIAQYLNKGVRTVQRWERQMALPVRRPHGRRKGIVLALSDDIDAWLRSAYEDTSELDKLRTELASLKKENERLRDTMKRIVTPNGFADPDDPMTDELFWRRCAAAVERSAAIRLHTAEVMEMSRKLKAIWAMERGKAWPLS